MLVPCVPAPPLPPHSVHTPVFGQLGHVGHTGGKTEGYKINVTDIPKEHLDDYYKWMWYWKSKKYEEHNGLRDMSDYILKSSVVPPVCPTCPGAVIPPSASFFFASSSRYSL